MWAVPPTAGALPDCPVTTFPANACVRRDLPARPATRNVPTAILDPAVRGIAPVQNTPDATRGTAPATVTPDTSETDARWVSSETDNCVP